LSRNIHLIVLLMAALIAALVQDQSIMKRL